MDRKLEFEISTENYHATQRYWVVADHVVGEEQ